LLTTSRKAICHPEDEWKGALVHLSEVLFVGSHAFTILHPYRVPVERIRLTPGVVSRR
jgi:hypothetical protein